MARPVPRPGGAEADGEGRTSISAKRKRRLFSIRQELIAKSKEAALTAIQVFNNPLIRFKSETFIVLMVIAWTYLLHAYYRSTGVEYRYYDMRGTRRRFRRTKDGSFRYWELRECLDNDKCPLDAGARNNLLFLIGLRNEIEHHMSPALDDFLSARYQACCANYNDTLQRPRSVPEGEARLWPLGGCYLQEAGVLGREGRTADVLLPWRHLLAPGASGSTG